MEKDHLHLLIHEEIYRLPGDEVVTEDLSTEESTDSPSEVQVPSQVAEPEAESIANNEDVALKPVVEPEGTSEEEREQESPEIPITEVEEPEELPFAVFHSSSDESEIELLHKIISACKLPEGQYKIFSNGFDQAVKFKKAMVFVAEAKAFYTPIPYKGSEFLCSKPLSHLTKDQNEKAKLWGALQKFVL